MPKPQLPAIRVELTLRTLLVGVAAIAAVGLLWQLWPVPLVLVVALMIAGALAPAVKWLERHRVRRPAAIALVFVSLFGLLCAFLAATLPTVLEQISALLTHLPETKDHLAEQLAHTRLGAPFARMVRETRVTELAREAQRVVLAYSSQVALGFAYAITTLFVALYLIVDSDRIRTTAFALTPEVHHARFARILLNFEAIVGGYLRGQIITSALMISVALVVLGVAGVSNALALALLAGAVDILPYIGAFLVCIPAFIAALPLGATTAWIVLGILAGYQELETRYIVPRVYGRALRLPASAVVIALLVGGKLLGVLGALLALPVAAGLRMMLAELRALFPGESAQAPAPSAGAAVGGRSASSPATPGSSLRESPAASPELASELRMDDPSRGTQGLMP